MPDIYCYVYILIYWMLSLLDIQIDLNYFYSKKGAVYTNLCLNVTIYLEDSPIMYELLSGA